MLLARSMAPAVKSDPWVAPGLFVYQPVCARYTATGLILAFNIRLNTIRDIR